MFQRSSSKRTSTVLDHNPLNDEGEDSDANEPGVVAEAREDIEFTVTKLTGIDLVEKLHEDESLEDDCVKLTLLGGFTELVIPSCNLSCCKRWICFINLLFNVFFVVVEWIILFVLETEKLGSVDEKDHQNDKLIKSLAKDVSPHDSVNDLLGLAGRLAIHKGIMGWLSSKCEGSKSIHNEVNPEHLDGSERWILEDHGTSEDNDQGGNIDCELELEELPDVIEDVPSILDSNLNRAEVIIGEDNISCALSYIGASNSHCKANVSSVQSWSIIGTVSGNSNR